MKLKNIEVGEKYKIKTHYNHDGSGWFVGGDIVVVISIAWDGRVLCELIDSECKYGKYIHYKFLKKIK